MDEAQEMNMLFDSDYQKNLFIIESALQQTGVLPPPENTSLSSIYDDELRQLIESVPLE